MPDFSSLQFYKLQGAGNDFLFLILKDPKVKELFDSKISPSQRSDWASKICHPKFGLGTDGIAFVEASDKYDFKWDFYNSDGSSAEMCGNAARCVARLTYDLKLTPANMKFETLAGKIVAQIISTTEVLVETTPIPRPEPEFSWPFEGQHFSVQLLQTGVPHFVVSYAEENEWMGSFQKKLAQSLRFHPTAGPAGANVTFYKVAKKSENTIFSTSFERGVEDFTLACGTGVLASGWHYCKSKNLSQCAVIAPGGQLRVDFSEKSPKLIGPAEHIACFHMNESLLKV